MPGGIINVRPDLQLQWAENPETGQLAAYALDEYNNRVWSVWTPQPGSQSAFLDCPLPEVIYEGTRGPGKTDAMLMDYCQHVGHDDRSEEDKALGITQVRGWGEDWRGIIFRRTFPELQDIIAKSKKWIPQIWPTAKYNEAKSYWIWETGEVLRFSFFLKPSDYYKYHGHQYPYIGWEELTTWPDDEGFKLMMSTNRSTRKGIPLKVRATTNPYGVGHNWVRKRYRLPVPQGKIVGNIIRDAMNEEGDLEPFRVAIHGDLRENKILLHAQPNYVQLIKASARSKAERKAWVEGSWDVVAGGMFDDVWDAAIHVIHDAFPFDMIPRGWKIDRSYDHGQAKPFSVGWWAESNGEPVVWNGRQYGHVPGDLFRIAEWYGATNNINEGLRMRASDIAKGVLDRQRDWEISDRTLPGPADSAIFAAHDGSTSVASIMEKNGCVWEECEKGPGSRKQGWQVLRERFEASRPVIGGIREEPGIFIFGRCRGFLTTVPILPRDETDPDDANTNAEDHVADEVRYRLRSANKTVSMGQF